MTAKYNALEYSLWLFPLPVLQSSRMFSSL